jgi:hypothetical protein
MRDLKSSETKESFVKQSESPFIREAQCVFGRAYWVKEKCVFRLAAAQSGETAVD